MITLKETLTNAQHRPPWNWLYAAFVLVFDVSAFGTDLVD